MTSSTVVPQAEIDDFLCRARPAHPRAGVGDPPSLESLRVRLAELAIMPGSVVILALPNGDLLLRTYFGCQLAGYVPLLMAPSTPAPRIAETAARMGAAAVIVSRSKAGTGPGEPIRIGGLKVSLCTGHPLQLHRPGQGILLTSGTSGIATGCLHDVPALMRNARRHAAAVGLRAGDRVLITLPMYYSFALVAQLLGSLAVGATPIVSGPPFTVGEFVEVLARQDVTHTSLTPVLVSALLDAGVTLPPGLRALTVGGQSLDPGKVAALLARHPGLELYLTYGLTQAGPRVSTLAAHREPPHRHRSVGLPMEGVRISVRDVGRGPREQEILVHSDTVFRKRVGNPSGRAGEELLGGSVLATGDLGHLDEDGYLHITGRLSDFVEVRGEKVSLASLRAIATSLPGVVAATAAHHAEQDVLAMELHVRPGADGVDEVALRRRLFSLLSPHERPHRLTIRAAGADELRK
jgi:acyl-CoA synthetase (AMP-forming)/AMP-acid ligase II